jgi:hypothetical protein
VATQPSGKAVPDPPSYLHTAEVADILGGHRRYPEAEIRQLANELRVPPTD